MEGLGGAALVGAALGGASGNASKVAGYNRSNYLANLKMQQSRRYHVQSLVMDQAKLFRQDIEVLVSTANKYQHNYLVVGTLLLNVIVRLYTGSQVHLETGGEIARFFNLAMSTSLLCFFLGLVHMIWANNLSTNCQREFLIEHMRLPIAGLNAELEEQALKETAEGWEAQTASEMFRVPFFQRLKEKMKRNGAMDGEDYALRSPTNTAKSRMSKNQSVSENAVTLEDMNALRSRYLDQFSLEEHDWNSLGQNAVMFMGLGLVNLLYAFIYHAMPLCRLRVCVMVSMNTVLVGLFVKVAVKRWESFGPFLKGPFLSCRCIAHGWGHGLLAMAGPVVHICSANGVRVPGLIPLAYGCHIYLLCVALHRAFRVGRCQHRHAEELGVAAMAWEIGPGSESSISSDSDDVGHVRRRHSCTPEVGRVINAARFQMVVVLGIAILAWSMCAGDYLRHRTQDIIAGPSTRRLDGCTAGCTSLLVNDLSDHATAEGLAFLQQQGVSSVEQLRHLTGEDIDIALRSASLGLGPKAAIRQLHAASLPGS